MSIDLTTGCTRDERGHNFNCHKICQWCNRPKDEIELEKLREQLRWRKWPEEKPECEQQVQLILANKLAPILCCSKYPFDHWENLNATHWRPIGPLPKEIE